MHKKWIIYEPKQMENFNDKVVGEVSNSTWNQEYSGAYFWTKKEI